MNATVKDTVYRIEDLGFSYPHKGGRYRDKLDEPLLQELNFSLYREDLTVLCGDNGCGKTTLGKLLLGILRPDQGRVLLEGNDVQTGSLARTARRVGYLFQDPGKQLFGTTVYQDLAFPLRLRNLTEETIEDKIENILYELDLAPLRDRAPYVLSQGEKQRVALAAILLNGAEYLVLDEPTTSLDIRRKEKLADLLARLRKRGVGILMIGHDQDFIKAHASRVLRMERGGIFDENL